MNRPDFQYDANGDALYRHYKDQYTELGKRAMQDTMGQAAALTGGYGSSYAQNVVQQAYQSYLSRVDDVIPELYQLAYQKYQDEGNRLYKTYQSWADLGQQAAQQERWEREYELEERKRQDANRRFQLEQERKNSQTQTSQTQTAAYQPDYWASLAAYHKLGQNNSTAAVDTTAAEPAYDNGKVSEGNVKTMQRVLGLQETGKWTDDDRTGAGGLTADKAWEYYQKGQLQNYKSVGLSLPIGNIKTMERLLGLEEDGYWSEEDQKAAGGLDAYAAWKDYQQGKLQGKSRSGMSADEWAELKKKQAQTPSTSNTPKSTPAVQNFIACMVTEDQAAERGVNSTEWKMMVVDRLNRVNMTMDEFEQLEKYYGLDIPGGSSAIHQGNTANNAAQKISYAEYRQKTAAQKISNLNAAVQKFFNTYQLFVNSAVYDIQNVGYKNAAYMRDIRVRTAKELQKQAEILAAALRMNGDIISGDYSELLTQIISTKTGVDSIMDVFEEQARYYSRWDTEDAYNKAVEQAEADKERWTELTGGYDPIVNKEEGKAGWEAYVADKEQSAQRAAEAEAKKASEGYSWEQFWDDLGRWMGPGVNPDTSLPFHTDVQLIAQGYRDEEAAKRVPDERWTDEQRYAFGYIWKSSRQKAGDYAYAVNNILNIQQEQEQLQQIKEWTTATIKQLVWNILKQGAAEGIEEGVTSVLNNFADNLIMGDKSNFNILVSEYMNQGLDKKDAKKKAWMNMAGDVAFDMLGGFVSGEVHAGPLTSISYVKTQNQYAKTGSSIVDADGGVEALMNLANQVASVSSAQMQSTLTSQIDKVSQNPTARNVGQLYATIQIASNEANASVTPEDVTKMLRSKRVNSKTTAGIADAIAASLNGQELTKTQRKRLSSALGSPAVQSVISDMQKTLTSRGDKVSQKPAARNIGQLNTTVQAASDQANALVNQEDVAKRLLEKGFYSKEAADVAEAVAARLNEQDLTRTQRSILSSALSSSAVRDTISEFINHRKTTTEQPSLEQRDQKFSGTADLAEIYERREKAEFAREHGGAVEKVTEALNTAALRSVGKNDFALVKIDSIKDVSWHKNVGVSKWGSKKLCILFEVEQKIVNRETERAVLFGANGELILQKDGERGRVRFTNAEISKMRGGTLTHNHPNSSCFSPEDIHTLFNAKLSEIRAVTSDGVFRLQKPIKWPASKYNLEMIEQIYYDIDKEICSPLYGKAYSGEISFAEAEKIGQIEVIKEFAKRYGLAFEFETWEDMRRRFNGSVY